MYRRLHSKLYSMTTFPGSLPIEKEHAICVFLRKHVSSENGGREPS